MKRKILEMAAVWLILMTIFACRSGTKQTLVEERPLQETEQEIPAEENVVVRPAKTEKSGADVLNTRLLQAPEEASFVFAGRELTPIVERFAGAEVASKAVDRLMLDMGEGLELEAREARRELLSACVSEILNDSVLWATPGWTEALEFYNRSQRLTGLMTGWGMANFIGKVPFEGFGAFMGVEESPFSRQQDRFRADLRETDLGLGLFLLTGREAEMHEEALEKLLTDWAGDSEETDFFDKKVSGLQWQGVLWSVDEDELAPDLDVGGPPLMELIHILTQRDWVVATALSEKGRIWYFGEPEGLKMDLRPRASALPEGLVDSFEQASGTFHAAGWLAPSLSVELQGRGYPIIGMCREYVRVLMLETELFQDGRPLQALLEELERAMQPMIKPAANALSCLFVDDGSLHMELTGVVTEPWLDYEAPLVDFPVDGAGKEAWLTCQGVFAKDGSKSWRTVESLLVSMLDLPLMSIPLDRLNADSAEDIKKILRLYRKSLREMVVDMGKARDGLIDDACGRHWVLASDTQGQYPPLPMFQQELVDKGDFPRFSYAVRLRDRKAAASSWSGFSAALQDGLDAVKESFDVEWTLPRPMSEAADGAWNHYYYAIPMTANECLPSLSLSNNSLVLGTSKKYNLQIGQALAVAEEGRRTGLHITIRPGHLAKILEDYARYGLPGPLPEMEELDELDDFRDEEANEDGEELAGAPPHLDGSFGKLIAALHRIERLNWRQFVRNGRSISSLKISVPSEGLKVKK